MDMTLDFVEIELADIVISTSTTSVLIDEMICKAQEDGINTPGYTYGSAYCADIYSSVIRGAEWQPQGGGTNPNTTPPEGGIDTVKYGYINGATRYYRGADLATSARFLTDNAGDFFVSLSIAYVDDERRANGEGDPLQSIMGHFIMIYPEHPQFMTAFIMIPRHRGEECEPSECKCYTS